MKNRLRIMNNRLRFIANEVKHWWYGDTRSVFEKHVEKCRILELDIDITTCC